MAEKHLEDLLESLENPSRRMDAAEMCMEIFNIISIEYILEISRYDVKFPDKL